MNHSFLHKGVVVEPSDFRDFDWLAVMKDLGLNTLGIHSGGGTAAGNIPEKLGFTLSPDFRRRAEEYGIRVEFELHTGACLLPRNLFDTHAEYFPMNRKGIRTGTANWCPSNRDAQKIIAENARALASVLKPDTHRYLFWGDDACTWCRCGGCHRFSDSDQALMAANLIADAVRPFDPQASVPYLAYLNTLPPPERVKPHDNVFLEFAPIERCRNHAIDDPDCAVNRSQWNALLAQMKLFPADRVHILEYFLDSSLVSGYKRPAKKASYRREILEADIRAYHSLGIRSITTFAVFLDGEYFRRFGDLELRNYAEILNRY